MLTTKSKCWKGCADDSVQPRNKLLGLEIEYVELPGADHNLMPNWNDVVKSDVEFFDKNLR